MTVKELKVLMANVPDEAVIVMPAYDHNYRVPRVFESSALFCSESGIWSQDYGDDVMPEEEFGKRVPVLVFD